MVPVLTEVHLRGSNKDWKLLLCIPPWGQTGPGVLLDLYADVALKEKRRNQKLKGRSWKIGGTKGRESRGGVLKNLGE